MFEKLPMWKDENPITYEKQQISMKLGKMRRQLNANQKEIKALEERYNILEAEKSKKKNGINDV
ncbi:hypothetical protein GC101_17200 [Paenibacillus sp. LMG 31459]|uniref:Uncharacterized protein n=1 Tax=Paenibacillus phytohabitans TaxID=2654978 RepID=A0ABX1YL53_9BACL|nr:hypothetical protein [Paenibacillus phytohabitans]NOU80603.1 hypothetical protein [Paenibacillus phytohabitans]